MKTVKKIFFDDIISLVKNFFALTIVIGICFLPALYAWFNIYSNWDPYGSTGALKFAAVSLDKGYIDEEGNYYNQGDKIIENLHENKSVDWQFVDNADDAINGVYSGEYYAAVIVDEEFTYNMYNVLTEEVDRPTLHFYENQKKNPVATKISDTVVQTLQNNINVAFTEVVVSEVFSSASDVSTELQEENSVDNILSRLRDLSDDLTAYQNTINSIIENDAALQTSIALAEQDAANLESQTEAVADTLVHDSNVAQHASTTINTYSNDVNGAINLLNSTLDSVNEDINTAQVTNDLKTKAQLVKNIMIKLVQSEQLAVSIPDTIGESVITQEKEKLIGMLKEAQAALSVLVEPLQQISDVLGQITTTIEESGLTALSDENIQLLVDWGVISPEMAEQLKVIDNIANQKEAIDLLVSNINSKKAEIDNIIALINTPIEFDYTGKNAQEYIDKLNNINIDTLALVGEEKLNSILSNAKTKLPEIQNTIKYDVVDKLTNGLYQLSGTIYGSSNILNTVGETFGNLVVMFGAIDNTIDCANTSLEKTNEAIVYVNGRLIDVINDVENAAEDNKVQVLIDSLSGNPDTYGKFFSTPVSIETEAVYPVENYGSAVAPFYSTLAFWVGALILTAIIKIQPDKEKYPNASPRQLYFGRYVLYWILGQIQAVIIVLGDLYLLHVQCMHPGLFLLAASVIATTFTILIYSIVVTWGDVGKALAVVIVVIQIAGSSGTYPIELLPDFFKKVYIFFPFPYAINAIRECLCGTYELDYLKYLGCLGIFIIVSLVIGLLVRIPFEPINHYMEERMEDTEMM